MKLNTLIVNDQLPVIENYKRLMADYCASLHLVGIAGSFQEARMQAEKYKLHIIFWDIDISTDHAAEIFNTQGLAQAQNVFVISYEEKLLNRIKASSVEYILKPVYPVEIIAVESKMIKQLGNSSGEAIKYYKKFQGSFQQSFKKREKTDSIAVYSKGEYKMVRYSDIMAFEALGAYTKIHVHKKTAFISSKNIGYYQELLGEHIFCRVHKSFIVNVNKIASVDKAVRVIRMINNQLFPVSVRLMPGFMTQIAK